MKVVEVTKIDQGKGILPKGVPPLASLYFYISGSCNLACRHCWVAPDPLARGENGKFVDLECVEKAVREARPLGLRSVKLTGGEPVLHPRFTDVVSFLNREGLEIIIETNGTLVDKGMAKFLRNNPWVRFISVSVDGLDAETHDALRGVQGSFTRAISGIKALVEVGFRPQLICTLHENNAHQMIDMVGFAEELGCGSVKFNHVQQIGRGEDYAKEYGLTVPEIIELYRTLEREAVPRAKIGVHFDIPYAFRSIGSLLNGSLGRCFVLNILGMLASGELSLCGIGFTVPELIYGHVAEDSIKDVWCEAEGLRVLRKQIPWEFEGVCGECIHRNFCMGECVANNFHVAGKLNAPYFFCHEAEKLGLFPKERKKSFKEEDYGKEKRASLV